MELQGNCWDLLPSMLEDEDWGRAKDLMYRETGTASARGFEQGSLMNKEGMNCV